MQITKVADTNHFDMSTCLRQSPSQVRNKPVCVALMEFSSLQCIGKSRRQSPRQSPGQVYDKVADLSRTQIMKVGDVICVTNFHDLCSRQVRDFIGNLSWTLLQSQCNEIWALVINLCSSAKNTQSRQ